MSDTTKTRAEINGEAQERMGAIVGSGDFDRLTEVLAADLVDHDPAPDQPAGPVGIGVFWRQFNQAFSDVKMEPVEAIPTDDFVTVVMDISGRHTGDFLGHAPTDRTFTVRGIQVGKFVDGKMTERWGSTDQLGILQQLGLV